jgi:hypothetical protein
MDSDDELNVFRNPPTNPYAANQDPFTNPSPYSPYDSARLNQPASQADYQYDGRNTPNPRAPYDDYDPYL